MKNLNPDKKIIYILNKYGYKKDTKTRRVCRDTDYYRKGTIENNDLEIVAVRRYYALRKCEYSHYRQEIIIVSFDNCYLMDIGKAAVIWKGSYKSYPTGFGVEIVSRKDYFGIEIMGWYLDDKYRDIIEGIDSRLYKLKEERK